MTDTPTPEPAKECCKCAAYRDIIAEQAAEMARVTSEIRGVGEFIRFARGHIALALKEKKP